MQRQLSNGTRVDDYPDGHKMACGCVVYNVNESMHAPLGSSCVGCYGKMSKMPVFSEEEKAAIVKYLAFEAKRRIGQTSIRAVDNIARRALERLSEFGAEDAKQEVYDHYREVWGG